jgi:hypothetical protein
MPAAGSVYARLQAARLQHGAHAAHHQDKFQQRVAERESLSQSLFILGDALARGHAPSMTTRMSLGCRMK